MKSFNNFFQELQHNIHVLSDRKRKLVLVLLTIVLLIVSFFLYNLLGEIVFPQLTETTIRHHNVYPAIDLTSIVPEIIPPIQVQEKVVKHPILTDPTPVDHPDVARHPEIGDHANAADRPKPAHRAKVAHRAKAVVYKTHSPTQKPTSVPIVKPFDINNYSPLCPLTPPVYHNAPYELAWLDGMLDEDKTRMWTGGAMRTLHRGMVHIPPPCSNSLHNIAECSAWDPVGGETMTRMTSVYHPQGAVQWVDPPHAPLWSAEVTVSGPHVFFHSHFPGNYGQFMDDHMPSLTWLREHVSWDTKFLLLENQLLRKFIKWFDMDLYNRIEWMKAGQILQVDGDLIVFDHCFYDTHERHAI